MSEPTHDTAVAAEIKKLKARRAALARLIKLRWEVELMEAEVMSGTGLRSSMQAICKLICSEFDLTFEQMMSKSRTEAIAGPRMIVFYLAREITQAAYQTIGATFHKDHGTIIHGCRQVKNRMETEKRFGDHVRQLQQACQANLTKPNEQHELQSRQG